MEIFLKIAKEEDEEEEDASRRGGGGGGGRPAICENMHDLVNWDKGYFDRRTCTCLHGGCVLGMS